jgi:hypothetical protein
MIIFFYDCDEKVDLADKEIFYDCDEKVINL